MLPLLYRYWLEVTKNAMYASLTLTCTLSTLVPFQQRLLKCFVLFFWQIDMC